MIKRPWLCLSLIFTICLPSFAQDQSLSYEKATLDQIILEIESRTNWVYNYDPDQVSKFKFSGDLPLTSKTEVMRKLLYHTPLDIDIVGDQVLIFQAPKQSYQVCGTIMLQDGMQNLPFANIHADGTTIGAESNNNGSFSFNIESFKNQTVTISYLGYKSRTFNIRELAECPQIYLDPNPGMTLDQITVTDYILRGISTSRQYNSITIDFPALAQNYTAHEHDILKSVQLLPGITSIEESATQLHIRGGTPDHNLILWENATLYDAGHFFGMISSINPFPVEKISIYKGVFDPKYENRIGGIIDISLPTLLFDPCSSLF